MDKAQREQESKKFLDELMDKVKKSPQSTPKPRGTKEMDEQTKEMMQKIYADIGWELPNVDTYEMRVMRI